MATLAVLLLPHFDTIGDDISWRSRAAPPATIAVRALCQTADVTGRPLILSWVEHPGPQEIEACPRDSRVRLAYLASSAGYLYVAAVRDDAGIAWQHAPEAPLSIAPVTRLTLLPIDVTSILVGPGTSFELVTVFSVQPLAMPELEAAVRGGAFTALNINRQRLQVGSIIRTEQQ